MLDQSIGLKDPEFWTEPEKSRRELLDAFEAEKFSGLLVAAPVQAPCDVRATLPVTVYHAGPIKDVWSLDFKRHALLTMIDVDANVLYADHIVDQEDLPPPLDPATAPAGYSVALYPLDAKEFFGLPWRPGRFLTTVVAREVLSNRASIEIVRSPQSFDDPEIAKFLEAQRKQLGPPEIDPPIGDPLPSYSKRDDSPPVPAEPGINLAVERIIVLKDETTQCVLRGSFRLPVADRNVFQPAKDAPPPPNAPKGPTAIVVIHLLVTGSQRPFPSTFQLSIPTFDPIPSEAKNPVATGHFALDLLDLGAMATQPQTVFIYAFSGEILTGPTMSALITPDMLPK